MQRIEIFQVDAFTDKVFHGNPAAVCLLHDWFNDELMQAIAVENNLSETAFIIEENGSFQIRWFTPNGEINLCGHATLAAAFVLFELHKAHKNVVNFSSLSGTLTVKKKNSLYIMDFPRLDYSPLESHELSAIIDQPIAEAFISELDYLVVLKDDTQISNAQIDLKNLAKLPKRGLIISAKSEDADFYSRCFYPKHNIPEDPVTGSAHCVLAPFWAERLNKTHLTGLQGSYRKGEVICDVLPDRVHISGACRWYLRGYLVI